MSSSSPVTGPPCVFTTTILLLKLPWNVPSSLISVKGCAPTGSSSFEQDEKKAIEIIAIAEKNKFSFLIVVLGFY